MIVQILEKKHSRFQRKGADLLMKHKITLLQALTGADFTFKHLDGRIIRVKNTPGKVIKHDEIQTIEEQGMPFHKKSYKFGNLFVQFDVIFPEKVSDLQKENLVKAFGAQKQPDITDVKETLIMEDVQSWHKNPNPEGGEAPSQDEEDDEDSHGGHRVGC